MSDHKTVDVREDWTAVQDNHVILTCTNEKDIVPKQPYQAFASLHIAAPANNQDKRPKLGITAVLDRSGSMLKGDKLKLVQKSMHFVIEQLLKEDFLGVFQYDDEIQELCSLKCATANNKKELQLCIDSMVTRGCTNLSGGLFAGIDQQLLALQNGTIAEDTVQAVLLCTDGLANFGILNTNEITNCVKNLIKHAPNLRIHTFGFGQDHDPDMLQKIAEAGKGKYFFVENNESIPEAFADALGGLLSICAQNVKITIKPMVKSFKILKIWDRVIWHKKDEAGNTTIVLSDLLSEIERKLLFEFSVGEFDGSGQQEIAQVQLSCFNVVLQQIEVVKCTLTVDRQEDVPQDQIVNQEVAKSIARVQTFEKIEEAKKEADTGNFEKAQATISQAIQNLKNLGIQEQQFLDSLESDLNELLVGFQNRQVYNKQGKYNSSSILHAHATQQHRFQRYDDRLENIELGFLRPAKIQRRFREISRTFAKK